MSKLKNFVYELSFVSLPHNKNTVKEAFGTDYYNPDFGVDTHARDSLNDLFKDAICQCLWLKIKNLGKDSTLKDNKEAADRFDGYMDRKIAFYEKLQESLKLARVEDTKVKKPEDQ